MFEKWSFQIYTPNESVIFAEIKIFRANGSVRDVHAYEMGLDKYNTVAWEVRCSASASGSSFADMCIDSVLDILERAIGQSRGASVDVSLELSRDDALELAREVVSRCKCWDIHDIKHEKLVVVDCPQKLELDRELDEKLRKAGAKVRPYCSGGTNADIERVEKGDRVVYIAMADARHVWIGVEIPYVI